MKKILHFALFYLGGKVFLKKKKKNLLFFVEKKLYCFQKINQSLVGTDVF